MAKQVILYNTNVSYAQNIFERHKASEDAVPKFSVEAIPLANDPQIKQLEQVCLEVAIEAIGPQRGPMVQNPIKTGEEVNKERLRKGKAPREELEGRMVIRASNAGAVVVSDEHGRGFFNTASDLESKSFLEDLRTRLVSGTICNVLIEFYYYPHKQNPGVFASLKGVQLVRAEGEGVMDFGGGRPASLDVFAQAGQQPAAAWPAPATHGQPVSDPSLDDLI